MYIQGVYNSTCLMMTRWSTPVMHFDSKVYLSLIGASGWPDPTVSNWQHYTTLECEHTYIHTVHYIYMYCIAGNFRGRKLSLISRFWVYLQKFSRWKLMVTPTCNWWHQVIYSYSPPIRESFLPRKFTAIRYVLWGASLTNTEREGAKSGVCTHLTLQ